MKDYQKPYIPHSLNLLKTLKGDTFMGNCCEPGCKAMKMVVLGALVIANEYYLKWNWWYLLGGLLVFKGLMVMAFKGKCCCTDKKKKK